MRSQGVTTYALVGSLIVGASRFCCAQATLQRATTPDSVLLVLIEADTLLTKSPPRTIREAARLSALDAILTKSLKEPDRNLKPHQLALISQMKVRIAQCGAYPDGARLAEERLEEGAHTLSVGFNNLNAQLKTDKAQVAKAAETIAAAYTLVVSLHQQITQTEVDATDWITSGASKAATAISRLSADAPSLALSDTEKQQIREQARKGALRSRKPTAKDDVASLKCVEGQLVWWNALRDVALERVAAATTAPARANYVAQYARARDFVPGFYEKLSTDEATALEDAWRGVRKVFGL